MVAGSASGCANGMIGVGICCARAVGAAAGLVFVAKSGVKVIPTAALERMGTVMGIPHAREEAFLRSRGPQSRQSLALKSVWPSSRRRREQSSQRIHLLDPVAGKQAGGTSLNADVQLSFMVPSTCGALYTL